jgi:hypothetical protein
MLPLDTNHRCTFYFLKSVTTAGKLLAAVILGLKNGVLQVLGRHVSLLR